MSFHTSNIGKMALGGSALGLGMNYLGGGDNLNQDFSFGTPESRTSEYSANPDLISSVSNLNQQGDMFNNMSNTYQQQYGQMIDPNSQYNASMYGQASQGILEQGANRFRQQNQAIASTGGGPASMATLLRAVGQSNDAESYAGAVRNIQNNSFQQAQGFGNMAIGAGQAGTSAFGQAGQFNAGIDARNLQNTQFNTESENSYNQYLKTSAYNQDIQNQNTKTDRWGNLLSFAGGVAGMMVGGPAGAAAGSQIGGMV